LQNLRIQIDLLVPWVRDRALAEALEAVRAIGDEGRSHALAALASRLAALPQETLYPLWTTTLNLGATRSGTDVLADLRALVPVLAALGGVEALAESYLASQDVGRWWA
jgi:hypothetical protein